MTPKIYNLSLNLGSSPSEEPEEESGEGLLPLEVQGEQGDSGPPGREVQEPKARDPLSIPGSGGASSQCLENESHVHQSREPVQVHV